MSKVWFVGAGPGDPDLITVKGRDLIAKAGAILFAGSLVSIAATRWAERNLRDCRQQGHDAGRNHQLADRKSRAA